MRRNDAGEVKFGDDVDDAERSSKKSNQEAASKEARNRQK
jgi:hypothetical protein